MTAEQRTIQILRALGQEHRWKIMMLLVAWGRLNVGEILEKLQAAGEQVDQPKVSHHLASLKRADLVVDQREGRHIYYGLSGVWDVPREEFVSLCVGGKVKLRIERQPWVETS